MTFCWYSPVSAQTDKLLFLAITIFFSQDGDVIWISSKEDFREAINACVRLEIPLKVSISGATGSEPRQTAPVVSASQTESPLMDDQTTQTATGEPKEGGSAPNNIASISQDLADQLEEGLRRGVDVLQDFLPFEGPQLASKLEQVGKLVAEGIRKAGNCDAAQKVSTIQQVLFDSAKMHCPRSQGCNGREDVQGGGRGERPRSCAASVSQAAPAVHRFVTCDMCGLKPITGPRYKCSVRRYVMFFYD